jgi:DNA-binding HxlR family transcriptional regulator
MRGLWLWPEKDRPKILDKLNIPYIITILDALKEKPETGLSNAEIDSLLGTASQWLIFWNLRELISLGIVQYTAELFGEPGKYRLTEFGREVLEEIRSRKR